MIIEYRNSNFPPVEKTGAVSEARLAEIPIPVLGSLSAEALPFEVVSSDNRAGFRLCESENFVAGVIARTVNAANYERVSYELYRELFEVLGERFLYRIWNYAPDINVGEADAERYRQFCLGRSMAFHENYGDADATYMPAGTCVGTNGNELIVCFVAGRTKPEHHENPNQLPAYRYPRQYGPRSPSFARATSVVDGGKLYRFISGTSSVIGHESVSVGDLKGQLEVTCDNLELMEKRSFEGGENPGEPLQRIGKVYLRRAEDYAFAESFLSDRLFGFSNKLVYLHSDICRKDLLVEIELCFVDTL